MGNAVQDKIDGVLQGFSGTVYEADSNSSKADELLALLKIAMGDASGAVYISTPITTGRAHIAWLSQNRSASGEETKSHKVSVIDRNLARVRPLVHAATEKYACPVIDPTQLADVPGWGQGDYHSFWVRVIEHFASLVVFADEWSYSNGCCFEFAATVRSDLDRLDARFETLSNGSSQQMLLVAKRELAASGLSTGAQDAALASLSSLDTSPLAV